MPGVDRFRWLDEMGRALAANEVALNVMMNGAVKQYVVKSNVTAGVLIGRLVTDVLGIASTNERTSEHERECWHWELICPRPAGNY